MQFQERNRQCVSCERILIGEYSGQNIPWGHAVYRIREYLGGGGMGEVYRAVEQNHTNTYQREVAVKFNKNMMDLDIVKRFDTEVQVLGLLQNPHNIRVYTHGDLIEDRGNGSEVRAQFMVMELLKGQALNEVIKDQSLDPIEVVKIFIEICGALSEAHQKGIIHRDLKPHNIMLQEVSGEKFAKVFDFGLSRNTNSMDDRLSTSGVVMGTFRYMSPEQALGEDLDHRTDIFSLGVVMYETLAGRAPFPAKNLFELFMHHQEGAPPIGTIAPELEEIVMRMLSYEQSQRYQSVDEVRQELQLLTGDSLSGSYMFNNLIGEDGEVLTRPPRVGLTTQTSDQTSQAHSPKFSVADLAKTSPGAQDSAPNAGVAPSGNNKLAAILSIVLVAVIGAFGAYIMLGNKTPKETKLTRTLPPTPPPKRLQPKTKISHPLLPPRRAPEPIRRIVRTPPPRAIKRPVRRRRRRRRRRWRARRRAPVRRIERVAPPVVVRKIPRPVPPRPRKVAVVVVRKVIAIRRFVPPRPRLATCPAQSPPVRYKQLDRALGSALNTRAAKYINRAARSTVYDAGLGLSQSWKPAPVLCKRAHLCNAIIRYVGYYCRKYRPHSHCRGYRPQRQGTRFVCQR